MPLAVIVESPYDPTPFPVSFALLAPGARRILDAWWWDGVWSTTWDPTSRQTVAFGRPPGGPGEIWIQVAGRHATRCNAPGPYGRHATLQ